MKQLILGLALALPFAATAQQQHWCQADEMRQRLIESDPTYLEREAAYEAEMAELLRNSAVQRDDETVYIIPLVFHIIHAGGDENLTEAQIAQEIEELNKDYRKLNEDLTDAVPYYQQIAGDVKVEFRLAKIDPNGNCTSGINRVRSPETLVGDDGSKIRFWPRSKYMNIWVVRRMQGGAAGYAYYPSALTGIAQIADGVIMLSSGVGVDGNTLTHELGHSFNLAHTWGANVAGIEGVPGSRFMVATCSDDAVEDTPFTKGHQPGYCRRFNHTCTAQNFSSTVMNFDGMVNGGGTTDPSTIPTELDTFYNETAVVTNPFTAVGVGSTNLADGAFGFSNWGTGALDGETEFANLAGTQDLAKYYEFSIDPTLPYSHRPTSITFKARRTANGPRTFAVRATRTGAFNSNFTALNSSSDPNLLIQGGTTFFIRNDVEDVINGCRVNLATLFPTGDELNPETDQTVTIRIYAWNAEEEGGAFFIDSLVLGGTFGRIENVENYMEYSYCSKQFTEGQAARWRAAAASDVGDRRSLWQASNLIATGTNDGYVPTCPPTADFYAALSANAVPYPATACAGASVTFRDNSSGGAATEWNWTFQDGTPATSNQRNPTVSFSGAGWKTVTLVATNEFGSSTSVQNYAVNISSQATNMGPFIESFEDSENLWPFHGENYDNNHTFFSLYTEGGFSSNACVMLNSGARNQLDLIDPTNDLDIDDLVSPTVNLSGLSGVQLSFRYSYSTNTTVIENVTEKLEVDRSLDCGRTWINAAEITGEDLVTNGNNPVMPPTEWRLRTISLPNSTLGPNNRFRFRFTSSEFSNNFFIDDINFGTPVGIMDLNGNVVFMNLYPNPTNDHFTLQVTGMDATSTQVTITDIRGAVVYQNVYQPTGGAPIELSGRGLGLSDGMYLLRAANTAGSSVTKLIVGQ
jgi:PKD repeat protein